MTIAVPPETTQPQPAPTLRPPSTRGYWVGGFVAAASLIGAIVWVVVAFLGYRDQIDRFPRMTVPGVATVSLADTSTRVLYYENSRGTSRPTIAGLGLTVTDPSGASVPVTSYSGDLRYDVPGDSASVGRAVAKFRPTQPGVYRIAASPATDISGELAVGSDIVWRMAPHAVGAGALFLVGGAAGVSVLVITATRRSRARR